MIESDREFGDQVDQYVEELEALFDEQYDPNRFYLACTNALSQLETMSVEAA